MTIQETLLYASVMCFVSGGVFLVIAAHYFITRDIRGVYADLTGRLRGDAYECRPKAHGPESSVVDGPCEPEMMDSVPTEAVSSDDGGKTHELGIAEKGDGQEFVVTRRVVCVHDDIDA